MENIPWLAVELIPDPDAQEELGSPLPTLTNADVAGSRLLLVQTSAATELHCSGELVNVVELTCTFHPAVGMRFVNATLALTLTQPGDARIEDIEPKVVQNSEPVRYILEDKGKVSATLGKATAAAEADLGQKREYTRYHCGIRGSGVGTARAQWTFVEDPIRRDGLGTNQVLVLVVTPAQALHGHLQVSARLARDVQSTNKLASGVAAFCDLMHRPQGIERKLPFQLDVTPLAIAQGSPRFKYIETS